jgi:single-strand DNA-binding protein
MKGNDMNEITITGNLVNSPVLRTYGTQQMTRFRLAHSHSYRDPGTGDWIDKGTTFIEVSCWRSLAVNVTESIGKGSAVIVSGRLKSSEWEKEVDGRIEKRTSFEIEATAIGPDLSRGVTQAVDRKHEAVERQEESAVAEALSVMATGSHVPSGSPFESVPGEEYPAA